VINVQCVMYEAGTKGKDYLDMTKYDMKIRIETGSPRIVYLSPFVQGVMVSFWPMEVCLLHTLKSTSKTINNDFISNPNRISWIIFKWPKML